MTITLKLVAAFSRRLPAGTASAGAPAKVADGTPVSALISRFGLPAEQLAIVNGRYHLPEQRNNTVPKQGDTSATALLAV